MTQDASRGPAPTSGDAIGARDVAIMLLAAATALIHLYLAWVVIPRTNGTGNPDPMFTLNGLGYLALVAALYLPLGPLRRRRALIRWVLIWLYGAHPLPLVLYGLPAGRPHADRLRHQVDRGCAACAARHGDPPPER